MAYQDEKQNHALTLKIFALIILSLIALSGYLGNEVIKKKGSDWVDIPSPIKGEKAMQVEKRVMNKTTVYDFAITKFQTLHRWSYDGSIEYEKNIQDHDRILTPNYKAWLRRDYKRRNGDEIKSELKGRTRRLTPLLVGWDEDRVKITSTRGGKPSSWVVVMDFNLEEFHLGQNVKNRYIRYPLKVTLDDSDKEENPWLLALDGYFEPPQELTKDLELKTVGIN